MFLLVSQEMTYGDSPMATTCVTPDTSAYNSMGTSDEFTISKLDVQLSKLKQKTRYHALYTARRSSGQHGTPQKKFGLSNIWITESSNGRGGYQKVCSDPYIRKFQMFVFESKGRQLSDIIITYQ